jgi:hypothetical protein
MEIKEWNGMEILEKNSITTSPSLNDGLSKLVIYVWPLKNQYKKIYN